MILSILLSANCLGSKLAGDSVNTVVCYCPDSNLAVDSVNTVVS